VKVLTLREYPNGLYKRKYVDTRKLEVENGGFYRAVLTNTLKRLISGSGGSCSHFEALQPMDQNFTIVDIIFQNQDVPARQLRMRLLPGRWQHSISAVELDCEMECATYTHFTLQPHVAAHRFSQALTNDQSKPGATELARGRTVNLAERSKESGLLILGNAYTSILH
jgi:hypothetical protein